MKSASSSSSIWIKSQFVLHMNKQSKPTTCLEPQVMNVLLFHINILNAPLHPERKKKGKKRQSMKSWLYPQSTMLKYKNLVTKFTHKKHTLVYKVMKMKKHAAKLWHLLDNTVSLYNCNWAYLHTHIYIYIYIQHCVNNNDKLTGKKETTAKSTVEIR